MGKITLAWIAGITLAIMTYRVGVWAGFLAHNPHSLAHYVPVFAAAILFIAYIAWWEDAQDIWWPEAHDGVREVTLSSLICPTAFLLMGTLHAEGTVSLWLDGPLLTFAFVPLLYVTVQKIVTRRSEHKEDVELYY